MTKKKPIRKRGKISFSKYFQRFKEGSSVAVIKENAIQSNFPIKLQGRVGTIVEKRGKSYLVRIKDQNKDKEFLIEPVHLKKINHSK